ncbi:hypothetical protein F0562_015469 [Nyssa sinensis]|uniref:non-specific serine/threonine protein kinase n=1 Tax=Nyssa sinensis TaxID=561372 RepID=A0A5J4ZHG8_9ASTE|nr:hypothetical protein F0562_015469 [Nyssa sinensis]
MSHYIILLFLLLKPASSNNTKVNFSFIKLLKLDGVQELHSDGDFVPTNSSLSQSMSHAFYNLPVQFKNHVNGSVHSFSTTFVFAINPLSPGKLAGDGMAFVISPSKELPGAQQGQYLGLFNLTTNGNNSDHIVAVELDTHENFEQGDIDDNHVGIDIDSPKSIRSEHASYFTDKNGGFKNLSLKSGRPMQFMYVGFSSSNAAFSSAYYIMGWSFSTNGPAQGLDPSRLPLLPWIVQKHTAIIRKCLIVALSLTGSIFFVLVILRVLKILGKRQFKQALEDWEIQYQPHRFTYKDLYTATRGFKDQELLGQGGFGKVYRGVLPTSNIQVAVKRVAHDSRQGMREFVTEIVTIGRLRHPNLVQLLGYCRHKQELLLVYDYMPNGSLDKFLYDQPERRLNWAQRFRIIKNVASGLFYLHQQWIQVVIHRDIKASNILIDGEMNGRLGDFGLAKLCDHGTNPQTSHVVGTLGYMAPELAQTGKANTTTDLYAFGAFMLEVVCGRRSPQEIILINWVFDCWERGNILEVVDPKLGNEYVAEEVKLVLELGLLCSHAMAAARPSMSTMVQYLEGEAQLPDNYSAIIKTRDFNAFNVQNVLQISVPSFTVTESFVSRGR